MTTRVLAVLAGAVTAGCFSPSYPSHGWQCGTTDPVCPEGFVCGADNFCVSLAPDAGVGPDAVVIPDAMIGPPVDVTVDVSTGGAISLSTGERCDSTVAATCVYSIQTGRTISFHAEPPAPSVTAAWGGACAGQAPAGDCVLVIAAGMTISASWGSPVNLTWATGSTDGFGAGSVLLDPAGPSCGAACESYTPGSVVNVIAQAAAGSTFQAFGDACTGREPTCTVTLDVSRNVVALFGGGGQIWQRPVAIGPQGDAIYDLTTNDVGETTIVGQFSGNAVDFGDGLPVDALGGSGFIVSYDPGGFVRWKHIIPGALCLSVSSHGNTHDVFASCVFGGTITFEGTTLTANPTGPFDAFFTRMTPDGALQWVRQVSGDGEERVRVATTPFRDDVYIYGEFTGTANLPGAGAFSSSGGYDVAVAEYDLGGGVVRAGRSQGTGDEFAADLVVDGGGNVYLGGWFSGAMDWYGNVKASAGADDGYVVKLYANFILFQSPELDVFGSPGEDMVQALVFDAAPTDTIYEAGFIGGFVDFNNGFSAAAVGATDAFILARGQDHITQRMHLFTGPGSSRIARIAQTGFGGPLVVAGDYDLSLDTMFGPLASVGATDVFVAKLAPVDFTELWSFRAGGAGTDLAGAVGATQSGESYVAVYYDADSNFQGIVLPNTGMTDGALIKLAP